MQANDRFQKLRRLSHLLDSQFEGPFGIRFGLDAVFGLFPIVGDFVTTCFSFYIVFQAVQMGVTLPLFIRMMLNIFFEMLLEFIPLLGNIFDFLWRANDKNIVLLAQHLENPRAVALKSRSILFGMVSLAILSLLLSTYLGYKLLALLWGLF